MRSAARLTYTLAHQALFEGRPAARAQLGELLPKLSVLVDVYRALHKARARRGALDFDAPEAEFVIDEAERVRGIELRSRNDAHRLIEECMILANVAVAQALEKARVPSLYRVHGQPEAEKLERLTSTPGGICGIPEAASARAICRRRAARAGARLRESPWCARCRRPVYQPTNIGHLGLAPRTTRTLFPSAVIPICRITLGLIGDASMAVRYETPALESLGRALRLERATRRTAMYPTTSNAPISKSASARPSRASSLRWSSSAASCRSWTLPWTVCCTSTTCAMTST
jgi:hypothetical protein